jgi:hypothetical protein
MKKILAILILSLTMLSTAYADRGWHHNNYYRGGSNYGWVAPAIIGGAVVYGLTRPYYAPPPVVYAPPPVYIQQPNPAYNPPAGYHWDTMLDGSCNCYKTVLVPN